MASRKNKKTPIENLLSKQLHDAGIGGYRRNVQFIPGRRFEADFWFPGIRLCVETDGAVWKGRYGGHTSGKGYTSDRRRDQLALSFGIVTVRFTSSQVKNGEAIAYLKEYIPRRRAQIEREADPPYEEFAHDLPEAFGM